MKTPQELGRDWEKTWAAKIQGDTTPGSGNKFFARLDVKSKRILWSNKYTTETYFRVTENIISEARDSTVAPGGNGAIPALAIRIESVGDFVLIGADDFIELLTEKPLLAADKATLKRATAKVPELLRNDQAESS